MDTPAEPDPQARHRARREHHGEARRRAEKQSGRLTRARVGSFLAALALGVAAEWTAGGALRIALAAAAGAAAVGFVWLVARHRRVRARERWHGTLEELAEEGLARLDRRWEALPEAGGGPAEPDHPYADDLDVLGPASLRRLLSTPATPPGRAAVRRWLLEPADPATSARRREAVAALAGRHEFRSELAARARLAGDPDEGTFRRFLAWAESENWLEPRAWLLWTARLLPVATVALAAAQVGGLVAGPWWAAGPPTMLALTGLTGPGTGGELERATAGEAELERYAEVLETLAEVGGEAAALAGIREDLSGGNGAPAAEAVRRLGRLVAWAEVRNNGLVHFVLQALLLWDVHVLHRLERWKARHGHRMRDWLGALGRGEALCALAELQADHPEWCLARVETGRMPGLEAEGLGHPLLTPGACVHNDVRIGPPGSFLLVTGSNMSGKSTLLRAVGLAVVLARAGGPVPARRCRLSPLRVRTVMRVEDSLAEGLSTYMAELERTRQVVASARSEERPVLYLLDEPLQGTNEAERRVALRTVLRHLLETDAVGAVATHDLRLHEVDDLEAAARPVHFTGTVEEGEGGPRLRFDYRLREGPATSTNALDLLRLVGLGAGEERSGEGPSG